MRPHVAGPLKRLAHRLGYEIRRIDEGAPDAQPDFPVDFDEPTIALVRRVQPYTLTSHERVSALRQAVTYLVKAAIPGALVECGVWKGGSMLAIVETLLELGVRDRDLHLFDTFSRGEMPPPSEKDVDAWGRKVADHYQPHRVDPFYVFDEQEVRELLVTTGYPEERLHFAKGMVEDTIPEHAPEQIALCRLDTDWYVSTMHELRHLFPRIMEGGVLLIDDYGHYGGSRQAVDEYFDELGLSLMLNRIDYTGRLAVVTRLARQRATSQEP